MHAAGKHVAVVAVAGDHLVGIALRHLHPDDDGFLTDVKVAESADQAHAIQLAGLFLEAADQEHLPQRVEFLFLAELCDRGAGSRRTGRLPIALLHNPGLRDGHSASFAISRKYPPIAEIGLWRESAAGEWLLPPNDWSKKLFRKRGRAFQGRWLPGCAGSTSINVTSLGWV